LLACLIFLLLGWTERDSFVTALSVRASVCIASSNRGSTSQDLKTGFLVGSTPRAQQIAILIGALGSALILGPILLRVNDAATIYVPSITFQKINQGKQAPAGAPLSPYTAEIAPPEPGTYRVWKADAAAAAALGV